MAKHGGKVSALEHAAMGAYFGQLGDIERATRYLINLTESELNPMQQAARYRSLANATIMKGEDYFESAHEYYLKALVRLDGVKDLYGLQEKANIYVMQARLLIAEYRFDEARNSLSRARDEVERMPCIEQLAVMVNIIRSYEAELDGSAAEGHTRDCVFVNSERGSIDLSEFKGMFRLKNGMVANVEIIGDELGVGFGGQAYLLVGLRDEVFEFKDSEGFFVVFGRKNSGRYDGVVFYQPNGVYSGHRVEGG